MVGRTDVAAITKPFLWIFWAIHPVPMIAITWMAPNGMLNRIVWKLE